METRLTVYFTSDIHGYLYPTDFSQPRPMGLLSMRFPKDGNSLVIDGGDFLSGSPLTYYCHTKGLPNPAAEAMNARGYDYLTLGNHDFNYGPEALEQFLRALDAQCLCANVRDAEGRLPVLPCTVRTMENGLRVGLVGIVTDWVNRWEKPENLRGLEIGNPLEAAREAIRQLDADVLIGIYHGGIERDLNSGRLLSETDENIACRLCEELPLDLLLTGHQHVAVPGGEWHGTWLVQPPASGEAYVRIQMDGEGLFSSELITPPMEASLTAAEEKLLEQVNEWLDRPVGRLDRAILPGDHLQEALYGSDMANLFNLVQMDATGARVSCASLANSVRGFNASVTVRDVVASYVYHNTLAVLEMPGRVLKQGLERSAAYFTVGPDGKIAVSPGFLYPKVEHYNYDYFAGISYTFDLRRPEGDRVTEMRIDGKDIGPEDPVQVCMCDYRAAGSGNYDFYRGCRHVKEIQTGMQELLLDYLRNHEMVHVPEGSGLQILAPDPAEKEKRGKTAKESEI